MNLFAILIAALQLLFLNGKNDRDKNPCHPFHVSTTQIEYSEKEKSLQVMVYIFTDDFENTLKQEFGAPVDLINPKDKQQAEHLVAEYLSKNLKLAADAKQLKFKLLGYEIEKEFAVSYIEIENLSKPKKIEVVNTLLLKVFSDQKNIVNLSIDNIKRSHRFHMAGQRHVFEF